MSENPMASVLFIMLFQKITRSIYLLSTQRKTIIEL